MEHNSYGFSITLANTTLDAAIERITSALGEVGFGILTRIDVHTTLKEKLDIDFRPYAILGACNPALAIRALNEEPEIGLWMPCNVVVQEYGANTQISVIEPNVMVPLVNGAETKKVMGEAQELMLKALRSAQGSA
jgi:uncharacterized protein (DUF302 family)